ncbi:MAG: sulfatase-like hydrolase/transferase, partial [Planctomycetota bacterium]
MNRRDFLKNCAFAAAGCTLAGSSTQARADRKRPNIVFLFIDDMGWRDVGFMGSKYYQTPNIDRLASEGMVFTNAYSNAPNCAPA